jgi:hypothetical protein
MTTAQNGAVVRELRSLVGQNLLTPLQFERIAERYPTGQWDLVTLVRWFTIIGAVSMGAGLILSAPKLLDVRLLIDASLGLAAVGLPVGGRSLTRSRSLAKTGAALELLGAFALQGLVSALAVQHSSGSDNWPALVGVCGALTLGLAYALGNRLILLLALINGLTFFGGETGYSSDWGMDWLGLDYPTRFVGAGLLTLALAYVHARFLHGGLQSFSRVYAHVGLVVVNLALWVLSLSGFSHGHDLFSWSGNDGQRLVFSVIWAGVSVGAILGGARYGFKLARGYGLTFLILNLYTFYFQFLVVHSAEIWYVHLLIAGGSMVALGLHLERNRSAAKIAARPAADASAE